MDLLAELTRTNTDPDVIAQVRALLETQQKTQAQIAEKDFKIKALTAELAYLRRVQYGKKSEAFKGEQRDLFEETVDSDLSAIYAELGEPPETKGKSDKPAQKRPGRQTLPPELPRIGLSRCAAGCGSEISPEK